jgi:hypothetical protein
MCARASMFLLGLQQWTPVVLLFVCLLWLSRQGGSEMCARVPSTILVLSVPMSEFRLPYLRFLCFLMYWLVCYGAVAVLRGKESHRFDCYTWTWKSSR